LQSNYTARLDVALETELAVTAKYSGDYFNKEIKGMAEATGLEEIV